MKKVYKLVPTGEPFHYTLYVDGKPVLTGNSSVVLTSLANRVAHTERAIRQHGGDPLIETSMDGDVQIVTITWDGGSKTEMRCIGLSAEAWIALEELAEATDSIARTGRNVGKPSWRALIRRIADGELQVVLPEPETKKHPRP